MGKKRLLAMPAASTDGATISFENPLYDGVTSTDGDDYLAVDAEPETKPDAAGASVLRLYTAPSSCHGMLLLR